MWGNHILTAILSIKNLWLTSPLVRGGPHFLNRSYLSSEICWYILVSGVLHSDVTFSDIMKWSQW